MRREYNPMLSSQGIWLISTSRKTNSPSIILPNHSDLWEWLLENVQSHLECFERNTHDEAYCLGGKCRRSLRYQKSHCTTLAGITNANVYRESETSKRMRESKHNQLSHEFRDKFVIRSFQSLQCLYSCWVSGLHRHLTISC
jgi:hypothetical protein